VSLLRSPESALLRRMTLQLPSSPDTPCRIAVIDAWGYLWTGGGSYRKGPDRKYILLRMDTQHPQRGMQFFYLDHETNVCAQHW
jgi:hypothetical protein